MRRAFKIAHDPPAGPVFVALPIDVMEQDTDVAAATPAALARAPLPSGAAVRDVAAVLLDAERPAIVVGDDVARANAGDALISLAEKIGAPVWCEGLKLHSAFPTAHPSARLGLPLDAAGIARALDGSDVVLLVGGPFFEDVWYSAGGPFPAGAKVIHLEESAERLAHAVAPDFGIVGELTATLRGVVEQIDGAARSHTI